MMGNNHKTALHDFIWRVFLCFRFAWLVAFQGLGDSSLFSLVFGSGLVLEVIKAKTVVMPGGFLLFTAAATSRRININPTPPRVLEDVDIWSLWLSLSISFVFFFLLQALAAQSDWTSSFVFSFAFKGKYVLYRKLSLKPMSVVF